MTYKPTDAELDALRQADNGELNFVTLRQFRIIARAVLAKWGSSIVATKISIPTNTMEQEFQNYYRRGFESGKKDGSPVVAGEVAAHRVMRKRLDGNWVCDGKYWSDGPPSKELVESICLDKDRWRVDVAYTTPQPTHAQADGFFLLLPQRPKPEAPAGTVGLDWDAYSGAQMLAFGRDSSDAAIAALRTEQPAPATQQAGERVYAFRRKGLADFCTCDEARYEELSNKPHLFETRIFYTAPQPTHAQAGAVPLTVDEIEQLIAQWSYELHGDRARYLVRMTEKHHGIKEGGQHAE